ncbi:hypothetical protein R2F61_00120 [Mollicutes bacterium LVI A0078]|nr:hypothetical protein RZE84_00120 [Mollicutes bacterium LVI A0075]WOO90985.1 hypothetical protein R2F61_00120 [Mollicutes bacterium LVI A0078]
MKVEVVKKYYSNIQNQLSQEQESRDDIFTEYRNYLQAYVKEGNLKAILQYSSVMNELNYEEQEIIDFLLSYHNQFLESNDNRLKVRFYVNLSFYYLASDRHFDNIQILKYLQVANEYQVTAQAHSLLGYYYYHNQQLELAKDNYQKAFQLEENEFDYINYKQLEIYLNKLTVEDNLSISTFKDEDNIELVYELLANKSIVDEDLCIMLKCNLLDCIIHGHYE